MRDRIRRTAGPLRGFSIQQWARWRTECRGVAVLLMLTGALILAGNLGLLLVCFMDDARTVTRLVHVLTIASLVFTLVGMALVWLGAAVHRFDPRAIELVRLLAIAVVVAALIQVVIAGRGLIGGLELAATVVHVLFAGVVVWLFVRPACHLRHIPDVERGRTRLARPISVILVLWLIGMALWLPAAADRIPELINDTLAARTGGPPGPLGRPNLVWTDELGRIHYYHD